MEPLFEQLTHDERQYAYFQQDSATEHTARNAMSVLCEMFSDRFISTELWPPSSSDVSVCDLHLLGNQKG
jgi:hypothetical protein